MQPLIASLPWYDLTATHDKLDAFWRILRTRLAAQLTADTELQNRLPAGLNRQLSTGQQWQHSGLLLSQCCGPDLFTPQARDLIPIARPVFADLDCTPGTYFSYIVSAAKAPAGRRLVVNSPSSRSGCNVLLEWCQHQGWQQQDYQVSGSHEESLRLIASGAADYAAIDAHSWQLLKHTPEAQQVRIIDRSSEAPAPPYVMHRAAPVTPGTLFTALEEAIQQAGLSIDIAGLIATDISLYEGMQLTSQTTSCCNWQPAQPANSPAMLSPA